MRLFLILLISLLLISGGYTSILAQEPRPEMEVQKDRAEASFLSGVNFGAGIMGSVFSGGKKPVESARVVNGVVRVEEEGDAQVGVVAEFHTLWRWCASKSQTGLVNCNNDDQHAQLGVGPSVGFKLGDNNIINAVFLGPMIAFRPNPTATNSFNLAIGGIMAPKVKVLGDGVEKNQPLPAGETEVRYKTINKYGYALMLAFTF